MTRARGVANGNAVLTPAKVGAILRRVAAGDTYRLIAYDLKVSAATVGRVARGETWQVVEEWTPGRHTVTVKPERESPPTVVNVPMGDHLDPHASPAETHQVDAVPWRHPMFADTPRLKQVVERYAPRPVVTSSAPEDDDWARGSEGE